MKGRIKYDMKAVVAQMEALVGRCQEWYASCDKQGTDQTMTHQAIPPTLRCPT